jgi:hypothetical protein
MMRSSGRIRISPRLLTALLLLVLPMGCRSVGSEQQATATPILSDSVEPSPIPAVSVSSAAEFQAFLEANPKMRPLLDAVKQTNPDDYQALMDQFDALLKNGAGQAEVGKLLREFSQKYTAERIKYASAENLVKFLKIRLDYYKSSSALSPFYTYSLILQKPYTVKEDAKYAELASGLFDMNEKLAPILLEMTTADPIPQNEVRAKKNLERILERMPRRQLRAIIKANKENLTDKNEARLYCQGYIFLYEEGLKLSPEEAVCLFRHLENLPVDDRQ